MKSFTTFLTAMLIALCLNAKTEQSQFENDGIATLGKLRSAYDAFSHRGNTNLQFDFGSLQYSGIVYQNGADGKTQFLHRYNYEETFEAVGLFVEKHVCSTPTGKILRKETMA